MTDLGRKFIKYCRENYKNSNNVILHKEKPREQQA